MKKAVLGARIILGLIFFVFGLNKFVGFMEMPPMADPAAAFMGALADTGYMLPLLALTEIVGGGCLLVGRCVPFGLTLLAPVVVNIAAFHVFLDPSGLPVAIAVLVLEIFLAWAYRDSFSGVLAAKAQPRV